jgi:3-oxoacyl-[acyl-carrier protein] reductase
MFDIYRTIQRKAGSTMDLQLKGKRAVVTGSSSGIGEAIAKALAAEGVVVAVHGRREAEVTRVTAEIVKAGGRAVAAIGDLSSDAGADAVAKAAFSGLGGVDILVNNAGAYIQKPWLETTAAEWTDLYNQNVGSMVRTVRHFAPDMKQRKWGRIIAIASGVATMPFGGMGNYSATKAANVNLAVGLAKDLADTGITSNTVSPGMILTPGVEDMFRGMAKQMGKPYVLAEFEAMAVKTMVPNPTGRVGRPADIAAVVTFLCSPLAGYVNGANIRVDGGTVPTTN